MTCGEKMREARKKLRLTQREVGEMVGCAAESICVWEKEKETPSDIRIISALEKALELRAGELYAEATNPHGTQAFRRRACAKRTTAA